MERFIVGHCRSGKTITNYPDQDDLRTYDEIFDAMAVLSVISSREHRKDQNSETAHQLFMAVRKLTQLLTDNGQMDPQMHAIGAKTSPDVVRHALRLLRPEFRD